MILDVLLDALLDSAKMLPFLFAAFLVMEWLEDRSGEYMNRILAKVGRAGPVAGALLGCIPQCGFSVVAANLFAGGILTPGTLLAVFLATSDEAVLILMGHPGRGADILGLLAAKVVIGAAAGYLVDIIYPKRHDHDKDMERICANCGCHGHNHGHGEESSHGEESGHGDGHEGSHHQEDSHSHGGGILQAALHHTVQIFFYILIFSALLGLAIELIGAERISALLLGDSLFQPLIAAVIGLIPNCAASVMLTELYLGGAISFASVTAGLCTGAGLGLVVLFRMNADRKENLKLVGLLYGIAAVAGILLEILL